MTTAYDVSYAQGAVDWSQAPQVTIIQKITQGLTVVDNTYRTNARGIPPRQMGGYHFAEPDSHSAAQEAAFYLGTVEAPVTFHALDIESRTIGGVRHDPLTLMGASTLADWCNRWTATVRHARQEPVGVYMNRSYAAHLIELLDFDFLWLATATGTPQYPTFNHHPVTFEQYNVTQPPGFSTLVDTNEQYLPIGEPPVSATGPEKWDAADWDAFEKVLDEKLAPVYEEVRKVAEPAPKGWLDILVAAIGDPAVEEVRKLYGDADYIKAMKAAYPGLG